MSLLSVNEPAVWHFRVWRLFLPFRDTAFPRRLCFYLRRLTRPLCHLLIPCRLRKAGKGEKACVWLLHLASLLALCQPVRPAQPWPWGAPWVRESPGAPEQRQVKCTSPGRVPGVADACHEGAMNLQHRTDRLPSWPATLTGRPDRRPAVHGSPSVSLAGGGGRDRSWVRQEVVDLLSTFFKSGMFSRKACFRGNVVAMATVKVRTTRC